MVELTLNELIMSDYIKPIVGFISAEALHIKPENKLKQLIKNLKYRNPFDPKNDPVVKLMETNNPAVVSLLIEALSDPEANIRQGAALILGHKEEHSAVKSLIDLLEDPDLYVRATAANSLKKLKDERAVGALIKCLNDVASEVRRSAAIALKSIGSSEAIEVLKKLAQNNNDLSLKDIVRAFI